MINYDIVPGAIITRNSGYKKATSFLGGGAITMKNHYFLIRSVRIWCGTTCATWAPHQFADYFNILIITKKLN